jgi:hypothetical protein
VTPTAATTLVALAHQAANVSHAMVAHLAAVQAVTHLVALQPQAVQAVQAVMLAAVQAVMHQAETVGLVAMPQHLRQA